MSHVSQSAVEPTDRKILQLLAEDGRMSFTDLGKATGLSTSAVHQRVKRLEQRGLIQGYGATINHADIGLPLAAFISIRPIDPSQPDDCAARLEHIGRQIHLLRPLRPGITKGRKADKSNTRFKPQVARNIRAALGNRRKIMLIRPFMHKRVGHQDDPSFMQKRGNTHRTVFSTRIKDMVNKFENMRRFSSGTRDQAVAVPMCEHK